MAIHQDLCRNLALIVFRFFFFYSANSSICSVDIQTIFIAYEKERKTSSFYEFKSHRTKDAKVYACIYCTVNFILFWCSKAKEKVWRWLKRNHICCEFQKNINLGQLNFYTNNHVVLALNAAAANIKNTKQYL